MFKRLFILTLFSSSLAWAAESEVRHPFVAGSFYPSNKAELTAMVDGFLEKAKLPSDAQGRIVGLISPHAGFIYSGATEAHVYRLLKEHPVDTVVLLGPYHKVSFPGVSIWKSGAWQTPLGEVLIDAELAQKVAAENPAFQFTESTHSTEHSLETQIPFLQRSLPGAKIVPILLNDASPENVRALAAALYKHLQGRKAVVIASSDMSHYYDDKTARTMDAGTLELLKKQDISRLAQALGEGRSELCGHAAVLALLEYAKLKGDTSFQLLDYSTSGDVSDDKGRVVGYAAGVLWEGKKNGSILRESSTLGAGQKQKLLKFARETVEAAVWGKKLPELKADEAVFKEQRAVFVTLNKDGQLRGCIGRILAEEPLADAVRHMAVEAATRDPRFSPVKPEELKDLSYEVSVLSPPAQVPDAASIVMGKHGVLLTQGGRGGVFLPKVAEAFDWDKDMFLAELCSQKAGLPGDCWKDPKTRLEVFMADEFSETS